METKSQEANHEGGCDASQDIQEHLEPEQELFLSRMAELQQLNLSSNEPEQTTTGIMAVNAARINFGLPVHQVSPKLPEKLPKVKQKSSDKGFSGILAPKSKTICRSIRSTTPKLPSEENNENISNNTPKTSALPKKENPLTSTSSYSHSSTKSASNSPLMTTKVPKNEDGKIPEVSNLKYLNSNPSAFTIPTLGGLSNLKPSLIGLSTNNTTSTVPSLGGLSKQSSTSSTFTIPNLGGLVDNKSKPTNFTIPSLGGLADTKTNPGSFTIPSLGGLASVNTNSEASKPLSLGGLAASKTNKEPFTIPNLGGLKDNKTNAFTIPSLGGLTATKSDTGSFNIPNFGGVTESKPSVFSIPSLQGLNISSTTPPSSSSLSSLANMHLSVQQTISPSNDPKQEELEDKASEAPHFQTPEPAEEIIDLMAALKSGKDLKYSPEKIEESMTLKTQHTKLLITDLRKIKTMLLKKSSSSIGKVITTRWQWKTERESVILPTLFTEPDRFSFATPSPDDIIMKAQSQSRSFLNTARQTKAGSPRL